MKDKIFGVLQRVGRSFMLPIAILPVAGLLLGIGSSFTNETTIATYGLQKILGSGTLLNSLLIIMNKVGSAVFDNLPLIFAVGVAIGMAKKEKEVAALSALIAYFVMNVAVSAMLLINNEITADGQIAADVLEGTITSVCGIQSLQMGVFGGIIVGLGVAALHNRFHKIVLPNALSFFGGSRFIPIISTIVYMFVGILMYFVWPVVQNGIYALGGLVTGSGYLGTLIFGIIKRALIPFGLHHVFYMPFWQTAVGGTMEVAGQVVQGGQNIFFAQLADSANIAHFSADATRYFSGEFIFMIFGLPGAALAMYRCAKSEKKKAAGGQKKRKNQCDDPKYRKQHTADFGVQDIEVRRSVCRIGLPLLCQRPEPFRFQENQDAANDKCNTAERVPPWHNIDLPTKSNGLCGKQADAR